MAQEEVPLVIQALSLLLALVNYVLCLFAVPVCTISKLTHNLVSNEGLYNDWVESRLRAYVYILWLPRFLVTLLVLGVLVGQIVVVVVLAAKYAKLVVGVQVALGIGLFLLFLYGVGMMKRTFKCLGVEVKSYVVGMFYSFLDAATFLVAIFTTMCVVRAQALCAIGEIAGEHKDHWRRHVLLQLFLTAADTLLLPFIACLVAFPWRLGIVIAAWKDHEGHPIEQRIMILEQWVRLLFDMPVLFGLVLLLVNPPRFFLALRDVARMLTEVRPEYSDHQRRLTVFIQILLTFLDPPALFSRVLVFITYYREFRFRKRLAETYGFYMRHPLLITGPDPQKQSCSRFSAHRIVLGEALSVLIDFPFVILGLFVVLTGWRAKHFLGKYRELDRGGGNGADRSSNCSNPNTQRMLCLQQFLELMIDVPFLFLSLFVFGTLYRASTLFKLLKRNEVPVSEGGLGKTFSYRRLVILKQFASIILDIPFVFVAFAACLTGVRIYAVTRDLCYNKTASGRRRAVTQQFFMALCDIPCVFFGALVFVTHYRWPTMYNRLKDPATVGFFSPWPYPPREGNNEEPEKTSVCCCGNSKRFESHQIVAATGGNLLIDLPFIFCMGLVACALFRVPTMYKEYKAIRATPAPYSSRLRRLALKQLFLTCLDIPAFLLGCLVFVFGFYGRGFRLVRDIFRLFQSVPAPPPPKTEWPASAYRWCVVRHLFVILFDIPALFCGALVTLTFYRVSNTRRELIKANASFLAQYNPETSTFGNLISPHCVVMSQAFQILLDLPFFALGAACIILPWRAVPLCKDINFLRTPKPDGTFWPPSAYRWCVVHHFLRLFFDIPTILCGAFICVTFYRFQTMKVKLATRPGFLARYDPDTDTLGSLVRPHCIVLGQFIQLLVDVPFFALGGMVCFFPWRNWVLVRDLGRLLHGQPPSPAGGAAPWPASALRKCAMFHFFLLFIDIPTIFCGGLICLTMYRFKTTRSRVTTKTKGFFAEFHPDNFTQNSPLSAHCVVISQAFQILIDAPFFALGVVVTFFPWRAAIFHRDISRLRRGVPTPPTEQGWPASALRMCALRHFIVLLWDVPAFFAGILIILTVHRFGHTRKKIARESQGFFKEYHPDQSDLSVLTKPHRIVIGQGIQVLLDLPFILLGGFVFLSIWRSLSLYYEISLKIERLNEVKKSHTYRRRMGVVRQFFLLLLDIVMFPLLLITLLSIIRFRSLLRQLLKVGRFYTPISSMSLVCSGRVDRELIAKESNVLVENAEGGGEKGEGGEGGGDIEMAEVKKEEEKEVIDPVFVTSKNPKPLLVSADYLWHEVILDEFLQLTVDLPFLLLTCLLLAGPALLLYWVHQQSNKYPNTPVWLTPLVAIIVFVPWVVRGVHFLIELGYTFKLRGVRHDGSDNNGEGNMGWFEYTDDFDWAPIRRLLILQHSVMVFLDLPAVLGLMLVVISGYRVQHTWKCMRLLWQGTKILLAKQFQAFQTLARQQSGRVDYSAEWWHQHRSWEHSAFSKGISLNERLSLHWFLISQGVSVLVDLPFLLCGMFVLATGWRAHYFCLLWQDNLKQYRATNLLPHVRRKGSASQLASAAVVAVPIYPEIINFTLCETCAPLDVASCERCLAAKNNSIASSQQALSSSSPPPPLPPPPPSHPAAAAAAAAAAIAGGKGSSQDLREWMHLLCKPWRTLVIAQRFICLINAAMVFVDLPILLFCGSLLVLTGYRLPDLIRKMRLIPERDPGGRRRLLLDQTCGLLADLPFILVAMLVVCTGYRGIALLRDCMYYAKTARHRRRAAVQQLGMFIMDIIALLCLPFLILTFYRLPRVVEQILNPATVSLFNAYGIHHDRVEVQLIVIANFFLTIVDIPFMFLTILIVGTLWRAPSLLSKLWARQSEWPCSCNTKRARAKLRHMIEQVKSKNAAAVGVEENSSSALLLMPSALMDYSVLPFLDKNSLCNFSQVCKGTYAPSNSKKLWKDRFMHDFPDALTGVFALLNERQSRIAELCEDGSEWKKFYGEVHKRRTERVSRPVIRVGARAVIMSEFWQWLLDIPFLLLGVIPLLSGLRTLPLLRDITFHCHKASDRRRTTIHQLILLFFDLISLPLLPPLLLTVYRLPRLWTEVTTMRIHLWSPYEPGLALGERVECHGALLWQFGGLLLDLPFNMMGLIACVIPYRAYLIYQDMETKRWSHGEHRSVCFKHFIRAVLDVPFILLGGVVLLFPWRSYAMCRLVPARRRACQARGEKTGLLYLFDAFEVYKLVLFNIIIIPFDLMGMALGCLVVIGLWRLPTLGALLDRKFGFRKSLARTAWLMLKDIFLLVILFPIIIVGIQRLPSVYRNSCRLFTRYRREAKQWKANAKPADEAKRNEEVNKEAFRKDSDGHEVTPDGLRLGGPKSFKVAYANFQREDAPLKNNAHDGVANWAGKLYVSKHQKPVSPPPSPDPVASVEQKDPQILASGVEVAEDEERKILNMEVDEVFRCGKQHTPSDYPMPVSLSLIRPLFMHEAKLSIKRFYHILLAPFRLLSVPLMPLYWYIGWRKNSLVDRSLPVISIEKEAGEGANKDESSSSNGGGEEKKVENSSSSSSSSSTSIDKKKQQQQEEEKSKIRFSLTMSFLFEFVFYLYYRSPPPSLSSWKVFNQQDTFMACMLFAFLPLLLNEVGVILALPVSLFLLLQSCGQRDENNSAKREKTCSMRKALSCVVGIIQGLLLPLTLGLLLGCLGFPIIIQILMKRAMVGWIIVQVLLVVAGLGTLQLLRRFATTRVAYHPLEMYISMYDFLRARGLPWRLYRGLLTQLVRCTYTIRRSCSILGRMIGELALMVVVLAWIFWPLVPPLLVKQTKVYVVIPLPLCLVLLARSRRIVVASWREDPTDLDEEDLTKESDKEEKERAVAEAARTEAEQRRRRTQAERAHLDAQAEERRATRAASSAKMQPPLHVSPELSYATHSSQPIYPFPVPAPSSPASSPSPPPPPHSPAFSSASPPPPYAVGSEPRSQPLSQQPKAPNSALAKFDLEMQNITPVPAPSSPVSTPLPVGSPLGSPLVGTSIPMGTPIPSPTYQGGLPLSPSYQGVGGPGGPYSPGGAQFTALPSSASPPSSSLSGTPSSSSSSSPPPPAQGPLPPAPRDRDWYYENKEGKQKGPVRNEGLRAAFASGDLLPNRRVWDKSMVTWTMLSAVPLVYPWLQAMAPSAQVRGNSPMSSPNMRAVGTRPTDDPGWICSQCTFKNPSSLRKCQVCDSAKWNCSACTFSNSASAVRCEMCDTPKQ